MNKLERAPIPILTSIAGVSEKRKAWFCDVWGVIHDGVTTFKPALQACLKFRERGGQIILISNAPRPSPGILTLLDSLGVPRECFNALVTSGDVTRELVKARIREPLFHLGPERDNGFFDGLPVRFVGVDEAALVVCTGLFDEEREKAEDYDGMLAALASRQVPMICANPDLTVERGNNLLLCAGTIAARYEALGQTVIQAGKPYRPIYDLALRKLENGVRLDEILAIGDGIDTDVKGASNLGIDAVYVVSRVHIPDERERKAVDADLLDRVFANRPYRPLGAMTQLRW